MNPHQKPLEISKPMWTTIAVVMGIALVGKLSEPEPHDQWAEPWRGAFMSEVKSCRRRPADAPSRSGSGNVEMERHG